MTLAGALEAKISGGPGFHNDGEQHSCRCVGSGQPLSLVAPVGPVVPTPQCSVWQETPPHPGPAGLLGALAHVGL